MKTIQINIEEDLLSEVDQVLNGKRRARSTFIREAIAERVKKLRMEQLIQQEIEGYKKYPIQPGEFIDPEDQAWPADWDDDEAWKDWGAK